MRGLLVILCMLVCLMTLFFGGCAGGALIFERFDANAAAIVILALGALVANVWLVAIALRGGSLPAAPTGPLLAFADLAAFSLMEFARLRLPVVLLLLFIPKGLLALHVLVRRPAAGERAGETPDTADGGGAD